jgi:hypothetical protein
MRDRIKPPVNALSDHLKVLFPPESDSGTTISASSVTIGGPMDLATRTVGTEGKVTARTFVSQTYLGERGKSPTMEERASHR